MITPEAIRVNSVGNLVDAVGEICKNCDLDTVKHQLKQESDSVFHFISELAQRAPQMYPDLNYEQHEHFMVNYMGLSQYMIESLNLAKLLDEAYISQIVQLLAFIRTQYNKVISSSYLCWTSLLSSAGNDDKWSQLVPELTAMCLETLGSQANANGDQLQLRSALQVISDCVLINPTYVV